MLQRGLWDETSFEAWNRNSAAAENLLGLSPEDIYVIHSAACIEFMRHGVTTVLNMFTVNPGSRMEKVTSSCEAFLNTGVRGVLALSLTPSRDAGPNDPTSLLDFSREVAVYVADVDSTVGLMLAPSAPQRCTDPFLISSAELAREFGLPMHTHLAETQLHAEVGHRTYGEPIVKHLERIRFLDSELSAAHCIWLEDDEMDLLKEYDVRVVHNPACNMKLADGAAQIKKMIRKGLTVGLGSDSVNAGTVYSIFEQMKLAVLFPRILWSPEDWVLPVEAFEMGCLGGAKALFQDSSIGSLEVGKKADLVILKPSTALMPMNDLVGQLALCENGDSVESVFVNGRPVMLDKRITTVNEKDILDKLCSFSGKIRSAQTEVRRTYPLEQ